MYDRPLADYTPCVKDPATQLISDPTTDWDAFGAEIETAPVSSDAMEILQRAAVATVGDELATPHGQDSIRVALGDPIAAAALETALTHVLAGMPNVFVGLRDHVLPEVYRTRQIPS